MAKRRVKARKTDDAQKVLDEVEAESRKKSTKSKKPDEGDVSIPLNFKFSWKGISMVLGVLLIISLAFNTTGSNITGQAVNEISGDEAANRVVDFISANVPGASAEITGKETSGGLHRIELNLKTEQGIQPIVVFVTLNGNMMFQQEAAIPLTAEAVQRPAQQQQQPPQQMTKSDKPKVELFVMSHCPFGTQAEKGMLPVAELLGDKIDFSIKFVNYAMHGEKEIAEETRQVCIQEEQSDKYFDYLKCFLEDDNYERCLTEVGIEQDKLAACTAALDEEFKITSLLNDKSTWSGGQFPQFNVHKDENVQYGVRGSPTLVVNGQTVQSNRDPASYLALICSAFNEEPEECSTQLSGATPSSGFGFAASGGSASDATCG